MDLTASINDATVIFVPKPTSPVNFCLLTYLWTVKSWKKTQKDYVFGKFCQKIKPEPCSDDDFQSPSSQQVAEMIEKEEIPLKSEMKMEVDEMFYFKPPVVIKIRRKGIPSTNKLE